MIRISGFVSRQATEKPYPETEVFCRETGFIVRQLHKGDQRQGSRQSPGRKA